MMPFKDNGINHWQKEQRKRTKTDEFSVLIDYFTFPAMHRALFCGNFLVSVCKWNNALDMSFSGRNWGDLIRWGWQFEGEALWLENMTVSGKYDGETVWVKRKMCADRFSLVLNVAYMFTVRNIRLRAHVRGKKERDGNELSSKLRTVISLRSNDDQYITPEEIALFLWISNQVIRTN